MGESNTIVSAYTVCIGTYNGIALTHRYTFDDFKRPIAAKSKQNGW